MNYSMYLSLKAAPLALTDMTASLNPHDEAACATPAQARRRDGSKAGENRIVGVLYNFSELGVEMKLKLEAVNRYLCTQSRGIG